MATGQDLVDAAATFLGQPYSTDPGRDDPDSSHKDCSGLIAAAYRLATGDTLGANVSVTIFDLAQRHGLEISREEAESIPGACFLSPGNPYEGWGPAGHIGFSDGRGGTVEATPPRVQRLRSTHQPWGERACLLPGIDYGLTSTRPWSDDMIYYGQEEGKTIGLAMQCNVIVATFNQPSTNPYGIPDDALAYSAGAIPIRAVHPLVLAKLRIADEKATH